MTPPDSDSESGNEELPKAEEGVANADPPPAPVDLSDEQQSRVNEAAVRSAEAAAKEREAEVELAQIRAKQADSDRKQRKEIADKVMDATFKQIVIADLVFVLYGFWRGWDIGSAINVWLAAAVANVISVALVIVRSLFPGRRE